MDFIEGVVGLVPGIKPVGGHKDVGLGAGIKPTTRGKDVGLEWEDVVKCGAGTDLANCISVSVTGTTGDWTGGYILPSCDFGEIVSSFASSLVSACLCSLFSFFDSFVS